MNSIKFYICIPVGVQLFGHFSKIVMYPQKNQCRQFGNPKTSNFGPILAYVQKKAHLAILKPPSGAMIVPNFWYWAKFAPLIHFMGLLRLFMPPRALFFEKNGQIFWSDSLLHPQTTKFDAFFDFFWPKLEIPTKCSLIYTFGPFKMNILAHWRQFSS